jgi:DNA polymerase bacteriophage-type
MKRIEEKTLLAFRDLDKAQTPPAKKLSLLLRPSFIARPGKTMLWGDWSAIEARTLPYNAASPGAEKVLDVFRESDNDSSKPDIYVRTGVDVVADGPLFGATAEEVWAILKNKNDPLNGAAKKLRQAQGKVPVLSLGFGGGLGALQAMAVNYGVHFSDEQGMDVVKRWRDANGWARSFWGAHGRNGSYGLWGAINSAIENPDTIMTAGRVAYVYDKSYLGGTVFCALPCGRIIAYPKIKWEWREVTDKKTGKTDDRYQLTYLKNYGRSALWYGKLAENVTQGLAASILRRTLKRLRYEEFQNVGGVWQAYEDVMPVVMHTHDEIVTEIDQDMVEAYKPILLDVMQTNDDWDEGLPLKAETGDNWYYTKTLD